MAGDIPLTRTTVAPDKAESIRAAVRAAVAMPAGGDTVSRLARPDDAGALAAFLSDPAVSAPIYSLPRPLTQEAVGAFIADHLAQRERGEGLLFVRLDRTGDVVGYSDVQVWPHWAAGELAGALRPDRQGQGQGAKGAAATFAWMFDALGLDLLCMTAAPDNVRTARLLDGLGFRRSGEIDSTRPDGTTRRSLAWEISRSDWQARHASQA